MDDRYRRELTKLHGGELPADLWDRVQEGPRMAPLGPPRRSRVTAGVVAFAVFALAAFFVWKAFPSTAASQPGGSTVVTVPPRGETSAVFLDDGRPVFVVHHVDGTVSVVDAFSSHRAWGVEELNVWCPSTREFVEVAHEAHFDEYGTLTPVSGPAGGRRRDVRVRGRGHRRRRRSELDPGRSRSRSPPRRDATPVWGVPRSAPRATAVRATPTSSR